MKIFNITKIIFFSIIVKLIYIFLAIIILDKNINYTDINSFLNSIFYKWDSVKYDYLVHNWYPHSTPENLANSNHSIWAFFPLYPAIIYGLMSLFSISFGVSAFIWSFFSSIFSFIGIYLFCGHYFKDKDKAFYISLFYICLPFSYYFSGFLTESTFLLLIIFSFVAIQKKKYFLYTFCASLLVIVRANGLMCAFFAYIFFLESEGVISNFRIKIKELFKKDIIIKSIYFIIPLFVFLIYCSFQYYMAGSFFAYIRAQEAWGRTGGIPKDFNIFRTPLFLILFFLVFYVISISKIKKNILSFSLIIGLNLLLPILTGSFGSIPRYSCVLFPLYVLAGSALYKFKYRYIFLILFLLIQLYYYNLWLKLFYVTA